MRGAAAFRRSVRRLKHVFRPLNPVVRSTGAFTLRAEGNRMTFDSWTESDVEFAVAPDGWTDPALGESAPLAEARFSSAAADQAATVTFDEVDEHDAAPALEIAGVVESAEKTDTAAVDFDEAGEIDRRDDTPSETAGAMDAAPEATCDESQSAPIEALLAETADVPFLLEMADDEVEPASSRRVAFQSALMGAVPSFVLHLWLLLTLAGVHFGEPSPYVPEVVIDSQVTPVEQPEVVAEKIKYELANPGDREMEVREVTNAMSLGRQQSDVPRDEVAPVFIREFSEDGGSPQVFDISEGLNVDERMVVNGTTGEGLIQMDSALDRVTWEIAQNLKERKVLVVWMLDASASLKDQRGAISKRLKRIYGELDALGEVGQVPRLEQPLLTGVVSYGKEYAFLTRQPTDKFEDVETAFNSLKADETGVENVFTAVHGVVSHWSSYRSGRRIMLVIVTDETGDDFGPPMEQSIALCRRYGAKAYVIGPAAVFGRRKGFIPYVAPENGRTYQLPVDLGPETAMMESVNLPFWFSGPQLTHLSSGFGPYGLSRLVAETGGVYFLTNMTTSASLTPTGVFDAASLKPFMPDYRFGNPQQYEADLRKHPLRQAVVMAALLAEQNQPKGTPDLELRVTGANFRQVATQAQQTVAESQLAIDTILQAFPPNIEKELDREPSPRWRMAFCLSYGRLLAQKSRCLEYNSCLAAMKGNLTPEDVNTKSNHWIFRPDRELNYAPSMKRSARTAEDLLRRILDEAPGTPWAVLASRELQDPFGLRVVERFIPPPPPPPPRPPGPVRKTPQLANDQRPSPPPRPQPPAPPPKLPNL